MFEVFNPETGALVTSVTSNIPKTLGIIDIPITGAASGSVTDIELAGRQHWFQLNYRGPPPGIGSTYHSLNISRSGNVINWAWASSGNRQQCYIIYGIY